MILEFIGLPGSGKSTLSQKLRESLTNIGYGSESPLAATPPRLFRAAIGVVRYWHVALLATRTLVASPRAWNSKRLAAKWFALTLSDYMPRPSDRSFLILDEGLLQRSFLLFMEQDGFGPIERVEDYVRRIPLPDVVIAIDISPAESLARLRNRSRTVSRRFQGLTADDQLTAFSKAAELLDLVLERATARPDWSMQIIRVPGSDLERAKQRLASEVADKLGN